MTLDEEIVVMSFRVVQEDQPIVERIRLETRKAFHASFEADKTDYHRALKRIAALALFEARMHHE